MNNKEKLRHIVRTIINNGTLIPEETYLDELETYINKVREEDWTTIHRAIIDALFSVNKRYSKDDVGLEGYGYNKGINKAISKLNQLLDLSEQYLQSIKEQSNE